MLIDIQYLENSKKLVCSYTNKEGDIKLKYYDWQQPYKYEVCDPNDKDVEPKFKSWDNKPIKKIRMKNDKEQVDEILKHIWNKIWSKKHPPKRVF